MILSEVIVISGQGTISRAVEAGQAGAFYFLEKPVTQDGLLDIAARFAARDTSEGPTGVTGFRDRVFVKRQYLSNAYGLLSFLPGTLS